MLNYSDAVLRFKALSDETRLKIIDMLSYDQLCACDILEEFQITQPTLSYHMKILTDSGLVKARKDGAWTRYMLNVEQFALLKEFTRSVTSKKENDLGQESADCCC